MRMTYNLIVGSGGLVLIMLTPVILIQFMIDLPWLNSMIKKLRIINFFRKFNIIYMDNKGLARLSLLHDKIYGTKTKSN